MTTPTITLPPATVARLEQLITQQQAIGAVIEATVATLREALAVPAEYQLRNVHEGFVAPAGGEPSPAGGEVGQE